MTGSSLDLVLERARLRLRRLHPREAWKAMRGTALLVDTRPEFQRRRDGDIPGAVVIERNHLEWRLDPDSAARIPEATSHGIRWIIICDEGYSSSLAAASLHELGLRESTDVIGGFQSWLAEGLPVVRHEVPAGPRLAPREALT